MRFDEAYRLWDRAGALWTRLQPLFKSLKASVVRPDQQIFHGDDRFTVLLALNRIAITDHAPGITILFFFAPPARSYSPPMSVTLSPWRTPFGRRGLISSVDLVTCKGSEEFRANWYRRGYDGASPRRYCGIFAILAAIRRASSRVSRLAAEVAWSYSHICGPRIASWIYV